MSLTIGLDDIPDFSECIFTSLLKKREPVLQSLKNRTGKYRFTNRAVEDLSRKHCRIEIKYLLFTTYLTCYTFKINKSTKETLHE